MFIVIVSILFVFIGVLLVLLVIGYLFGFMVMFGLFVLVGIIVNNVVLLLECIEVEFEEGFLRCEVVVLVVVKWFCLIFMIKFICIVGLVFLMLFVGLLWIGMVIIMIGGLVLGIFVMLGFILVLYDWLFSFCIWLEDVC